jgi:hypothetical protein
VREKNFWWWPGPACPCPPRTADSRRPGGTRSKEMQQGQIEFERGSMSEGVHCTASTRQPTHSPYSTAHDSNSACGFQTSYSSSTVLPVYRQAYCRHTHHVVQPVVEDAHFQQQYSLCLHIRTPDAPLNMQTVLQQYTASHTLTT